MKPERWRQITAIFEEAAARAGAEREAYLARRCDGDAALRREIESLLAHGAHDSFLASPATLPTGTRIRHYEVRDVIGFGGMGVVYRAIDMKLQRDVAVKVLPDSVAADPDRIARFRREATVLASLNHPNIGAIYGFEDSGDVHALVLEIVDGATLADRIADGPIPLDEAVAIARQIADGLQAAHEQGIIHRDLKPANIKLRPDGTVKVLDFGLAKLAESTTATANPSALSVSPTITSPAFVSGVGVLLGTAAYMSPEQAKGKPADKRSDIWAFGCVLYEMLAGKRPFEGDDINEVLAAVVRLEPNWLELPPEIPSSIRLLLQETLVKDARARVSDMSTALFILKNGASLVQNTERHAGRRQWRPAFRTLAAVAATAIVSVAITWVGSRHPVESARASRLHVLTTGTAEFSGSAGDRDVTITPDGSRIIYVGNRGTQLFVRAIDALDPIAVFTGAPRGPFISPDGQWIAFFDRANTMKKVAITGGPAVTLATLDGAPRGGTWGPDDTITIATNNQASGLQKVSAAGGTLSPLTHVGSSAVDHLWPEMLPGGRAVLFTISPRTLIGAANDAAQVAALDLQSGATTILIRGGSHGQYATSGHLVYANAGALLAVPFDPSTLAIHGTAVPVVSDVVMLNNSGVDAAVAPFGTLVYARGPSSGMAPRSLVWVDRLGREEPVPAPPRAYGVVRLSPDGARAVVDVREGTNDLWTWDFARSALTRLTFDPAEDDNPVWTPDGHRIVFRTLRSGTPELFWTVADGSGTPERLPIGPMKAIGNGSYPRAVSPDGRSVVLGDTKSRGDQDLIEAVLGQPLTSRSLVSTPANETSADVSPDGRWLAYESDESGQDEVYVRPFPDVNGGRWQISSGGGSKPVWARNGLELFYIDRSGSLVSVTVRKSQRFDAGKPVVLFPNNHYVSTGPRAYDVSPDGQRFLFVKDITSVDQAATPRNLIVVLNWTEELKRLVPTK
jgi:serine/threonine-protein kinase